MNYVRAWDEFEIGMEGEGEKYKQVETRASSLALMSAYLHTGVDTTLRHFSW